MKYFAQTCTKPEEEQQRKNQDAILSNIKSDDGDYYFALADGAGAYGAFNSDWSKLLVEKCPSEPLKSVEAIDTWINSFYEAFFEECKQKLTNGYAHLVNKFWKEGSASTLVACWKKGDFLYLMSYGDSFYALKIGEKWHFPPQRNTIEQYQRNPYLLNWQHQKTVEKDFSFTDFPIAEQKFELYVATDAIGQLILQHYQKDGFIDGFMQKLKESLESEETFSKCVLDFYQKEELEADDYSLVYFCL